MRQGICALVKRQKPAQKNQCGEAGGEGRNRTDECSFCRAVPYHLATPPTGFAKINEARPVASL